MLGFCISQCNSILSFVRLPRKDLQHTTSQWHQDRFMLQLWHKARNAYELKATQGLFVYNHLL